MKKLYKKWMKVVYWIGNLNARILLSIFYVIIILPYAVIIRIFMKDRKYQKGTRWVEYKVDQKEKDRLKEQY